MRDRKRIVILGNTLILGALEESIRRGGQFDVVCLARANDVDELGSMKPDAILFDLATPHMEFIFSLSESFSKLLLVGISPDTNIVKMWVGRQLQELTTQGLLTVIKDQMNVSAFEGGVAQLR